MDRSDLTEALREIGRHPSPPADLFARVAERARRRARVRYAVGSAAVGVVVLAVATTAFTLARPSPTAQIPVSPSRSVSTAPSPTAPALRSTTPKATTVTAPVCTDADVAVYFAGMQPPQQGGPILIGMLTVYNRRAHPCRVTGTVTAVALDAAGHATPTRVDPSSAPIDAVLPVNGLDDLSGVGITLRGGEPADGPQCSVADRVTPTAFRFTIGHVSVSTANRPKLWGCRGTRLVLQAGVTGDHIDR